MFIILIIYNEWLSTAYITWKKRQEGQNPNSITYLVIYMELAT